MRGIIAGLTMSDIHPISRLLNDMACTIQDFKPELGQNTASYVRAFFAQQIDVFNIMRRDYNGRFRDTPTQTQQKYVPHLYLRDLVASYYLYSALDELDVYDKTDNQNIDLQSLARELQNKAEGFQTLYDTKAYVSLLGDVKLFALEQLGGYVDAYRNVRLDQLDSIDDKILKDEKKRLIESEIYQNVRPAVEAYQNIVNDADFDMLIEGLSYDHDLENNQLIADSEEIQRAVLLDSTGGYSESVEGLKRTFDEALKQHNLVLEGDIESIVDGLSLVYDQDDVTTEFVRSARTFIGKVNADPDRFSTFRGAASELTLWLDEKERAGEKSIDRSLQDVSFSPAESCKK